MQSVLPLQATPVTVFAARGAGRKERGASVLGHSGKRDADTMSPELMQTSARRSSASYGGCPTRCRRSDSFVSPPPHPATARVSTSPTVSSSSHSTTTSHPLSVKCTTTSIKVFLRGGGGDGGGGGEGGEGKDPPFQLFGCSGVSENPNFPFNSQLFTKTCV